MRLQRFDLYVLLAALGFSGVLVSQAYWVNSGLMIRRDQLDRGVHLAMRTVLNRLIDQFNTQKIRCLELEEGCNDLGTSIEVVVPAALLDSLLHQEMLGLGLGERYKYAVFNRLNKRFVTGRYAGFEDKIVNSNYQVSLKALYTPGDYVLAVYCAETQHRIIGRFWLWVLVSAVFLILLLYSFWSTVSLIRRHKRLSKVKSDFINNMTHELKTPIASISLAAEMLSKPVVANVPDKVLKYAAVVKGESARLQTLVDHVLMSALLEEEKVRLSTQRASLSALVQEVLSNVEHRVNALSGKLEIYIEPGLSPLKFDRMHMTNVLVNLLDNAIKYSHGAPDIKVSLQGADQWQVIAVADKGIGIPAEEKNLIFKKLYRSYSGNVHDVKGFGIGLFYVKKIVELHGGKITVESEPGAGSIFRIYLPTDI